MKRILSFVVVMLVGAAVASAAPVPKALKAKVATDSQLAAVTGGATYGGGTPSVVMPQLTIGNSSFGGATWTLYIPTLTLTQPVTPIVQWTPLVVNNSGTWTIQLPTVTITMPATPIVDVGVIRPMVTRVK